MESFHYHDLSLPKTLVHQYWPVFGGYHVMRISDTENLIVHLLEEQLRDSFILRTFKLEYHVNSILKSSRTVKQYHFVDWKHNAIPSSKNLLDLQRTVNKDIEVIRRRSKLPQKPTVLVQCKYAMINQVKL